MSESVARAWFRRVWNEMDDKAIDDLFAPDGIAHGIHGDEIRGPKEFRAFHRTFSQMFADIKIDILHEIVSGNECAIRCECAMTHRATGRRQTMQGTCFLTFRNGQILHAWNHWDFLGLLEGLRLLPKRSFERAMSGSMDPHPASEKDM